MVDRLRNPSSSDAGEWREAIIELIGAVEMGRFEDLARGVVPAVVETYKLEYKVPFNLRISLMKGVDYEEAF